MKQKITQEIERLIKLSLAFHNLNKIVEQQLGLSLVQYYCLSNIRDRPGISSQSLAKAIGTHPSSLTSTMKRLSSRKFIFIGEDPKDSRKNMLSLTTNGNKALDRFEGGIEDILRIDPRANTLSGVSNVHSSAQ